MLGAGPSDIEVEVRASDSLCRLSEGVKWGGGPTLPLCVML